MPAAGAFRLSEGEWTMKRGLALLLALLLLSGCGAKKETERDADAQPLSALVEEPVPTKPATIVSVTTEGQDSPQEAAEMPPDETPAAAPAEELPDIDIHSWEYILANADHDIGEYAPEIYYVEEQPVDIRAADALTAFFAAARAEGLTVYLSSAYRDYDTQNYLYQRKVEQYGDPEAAAAIVAPPGTSEHQTGLAFDITDRYYELKTTDLENTELYRWMSQHCQEYGFIVRYPKDKQDITGIIYEPWHFRYVGVEAATYIMAHGLCLEEFLALYGVD